MTGPDTPGPSTGAGWAWLLALPVLCCAGPAVLAAVGAGSLTAALGGITGSLFLLAAGTPVLVVAATVLARHRRARR
jgi:hypothetical protein